MILFKKHFIPKIKLGEKTETRRLWDKPRVKVGSIHEVRSDLQSSFKRLPPECHIKILAVYPERLSIITPESVRREGFPDGNVANFISKFKDINGQKAKIKKLVPEGASWNDWDPELYVVKFKLHVDRTTQTKLEVTA